MMSLLSLLWILTVSLLLQLSLSSFPLLCCDGDSHLQVRNKTRKLSVLMTLLSAGSVQRMSPISIPERESVDFCQAGLHQYKLVHRRSSHQSRHNCWASSLSLHHQVCNMIRGRHFTLSYIIMIFVIIILVSSNGDGDRVVSSPQSMERWIEKANSVNTKYNFSTIAFNVESCWKLDER